jgi:hypothetical protein
MTEATNMPDGLEALGDWNLLTVDDTPIPVMCRVDINLPVEIDVQKATGKKKARLRDSGDMPAKITVTLTVTSAKEAADLKAVMSLLRPKSVKGERQARSVMHPQLWFWDIDKVVFTGIKSEQPDLVNGWKIEIEALEWVPKPKEAKAKIDSSYQKELEQSQWIPDGPDAQSRIGGSSQATPGSGFAQNDSPSHAAATNLF